MQQFRLTTIVLLSVAFTAFYPIASVLAAEPVVEGSCTILDTSGAGKQASKLTFQPTDAGGAATGTVQASAAGDGVRLRGDLRDLPPAGQIGFQFLTHVLWAVGDDGSFMSLGALDVRNGRARIDTTFEGTRFGLLVTAEPYFSVARPSSGVLLYAAVEEQSVQNVTVSTTKCEFLDGRYYAFDRTEVAVALTLKRDAKTPLELLQARHAFKIAELAGGARYQPTELEKVAAMLLDAERAQSSRAGSAEVVSGAREIVVAAEAVRLQAGRAAEESRVAEDRRTAQERETARLAEARRAEQERESARLTAERREAHERETARLAAEQQAQLAELTRLAAERTALEQELKLATEQRQAAAAAAAGVADASGTPVIPASPEAADDAANASLEAERSRLRAERVQLEAERVKQQADLGVERARIEAESATLRAQLAEENVAREREANATVRAEAEAARREAEQAKIDAEVARRGAELAAERARIEVERAQFDAQRKSAESEIALRQQLEAESAQKSATRTEAQQQEETERMRQQFELELQQRELERERQTLAADKLAQQAMIDEHRSTLDAEREQIVTQLEADQAKLAAERAELERVRRADEARRAAEAQRAEEERLLQLTQGRVAMQAELEQKRQSMQQELDSERVKLRAAMEAEMQAEMEAERMRMREEFEREGERLAEAAETRRVLQTEQDRRARRERLLDQLTEVLEARDTDQGLLVNLSGVSFAAGQHELQPEAREKLARLAGILLANPTLVAAIDGHTDSTGSVEGNQLLSEKRALAVRDYLVSQGVPAEALTARGLGAASPIARNETAEGRRENRRIELLISGAAIDVDGTITAKD